MVVLSMGRTVKTLKTGGGCYDEGVVGCLMIELERMFELKTSRTEVLKGASCSLDQSE